MKHNNLQRTAPLGEIGPWRCAYCGTIGLVKALLAEECPQGVSSERAIIDAVEGKVNDEKEN